MKICPKCKDNHFKSGTFCSRVCANSRIRTDNIKNKIRNGVIDKIQPSLFARIERFNSNPTQCKVCGKINSYTNRRRMTCSAKCYKLQNKISAQKGGLKAASSLKSKRSKNEIALYELCKNYFNNVTHNDPIFNGWDADILLHDYKIAILWNGDWHYQEMNCYNHSLKQVQNRDQYKSKLIKEAGWIEYIVKDTTKEPTKPIDAFKSLLKYINAQLYH